MFRLRKNAIVQNDPAMAADVLQEAEAGNVDAQYMAGLLFAEGRGVARDEVLSFFWLSLASQQGDVDARMLRTMVVSSMTEGQFDKAQKLLDDFRKGSFPAYRIAGLKLDTKSCLH